MNGTTEQELRKRAHDAEWALERARDELAEVQRDLARVSGALEAMQAERNALNLECGKLARALVGAVRCASDAYDNLGRVLEEDLSEELKLARRW